MTNPMTTRQLKSGAFSQNLIQWLSVAAVAYLVIMPLLVLFYGSVTNGPPGRATAFTLGNYAKAFGSTGLAVALRNSFVYAIGSSILAFILGTFLAWVTQRTDTPGRQIIFLGALIPLFFPTILMTVSWILLLSPNIGFINKLLMDLFGLDKGPLDIYGMGGMIWVGGIMETSLAFLWMWPSLNTMDPTLEEASKVAGANTLATFYNISLKLSTPAMLATWLIIMVRQLESFAVPGLLGMPRGINVLATDIYLTTTRTPRDINLATVYGVVLLVITFFGIALYRRAVKSSERYVTVTGKGYKAGCINLGNWKYLTLGLSLFIILMIFVLPIFALVFTSFSPYLQAPSMESLGSLTLKNYRDALNYQIGFRALRNSLLLGMGSGLIVMFLSAVIAWIVLRTRLRMRNALDFLATAPVAIPGVVAGLSIMWVYLILPIPIYGTIWILLVAYMTRFLPYGMRISYSALTQIHRELEEASFASGGGWMETFRRVTLPLLAPSFIVGTIYILLQAVRELPASIMLSSFGHEVFSVTIYDLWEGGYAGRVAAWGVIVIAILSVVSILVQTLGKKMGIRL